MKLALSKSDARAIYKAMAALAAVEARLFYAIVLPEQQQTFNAYDGGTYGVSVEGRTVEEYETLGDFARAYRLIRAT